MLDELQVGESLHYAYGYLFWFMLREIQCNWKILLIMDQLLPCDLPAYITFFKKKKKVKTFS